MIYGLVTAVGVIPVAGALADGVLRAAPAVGLAVSALGLAGLVRIRARRAVRAQIATPSRALSATPAGIAREGTLRARARGMPDAATDDESSAGPSDLILMTQRTVLIPSARRRG